MKSLKEELKDSKQILILLSKNPYLDQVASGLALYLALKEYFKVSVVCPSPMLVEYNRLVGVDKVTSEMGEKNLIISFKNYNAQNIERVTYDIEDNEFKLTIIPKADVESPTQENININKTNSGNFDTVILIGGANESHFPDISNERLISSKLIHIGKQEINFAGKSVISITKQIASVSELVADISKEFKNYDEDLASNLLSGIREGTRDFSHSWVNADTFRIAYELMSVMKTENKVEYTKPEPAIKSFKDAFKKLDEHKKTEEKETANFEDSEENITPPASWLEPKIFKGTAKN